MPIVDEAKTIIGAIGFVLYHHLDRLKPLIARVIQLESDLRTVKQQLSQPRSAHFTFDDYVGDTDGIARAKELARRGAALRRTFSKAPRRRNPTGASWRFRHRKRQTSSTAALGLR